MSQTLEMRRPLDLPPLWMWPVFDKTLWVFDNRYNGTAAHETPISGNEQTSEDSNSVYPGMWAVIFHQKLEFHILPCWVIVVVLSVQVHSLMCHENKMKDSQVYFIYQSLTWQQVTFRTVGDIFHVLSYFGVHVNVQASSWGKKATLSPHGAHLSPVKSTWVPISTAGQEVWQQLQHVSFVILCLCYFFFFIFF